MKLVAGAVSSPVLIPKLELNTCTSMQFPKRRQSAVRQRVMRRSYSSSSSSEEKKSIWARLGQRFNPAGIVSTVRVIAWERHLAVPHLRVRDISWIDWEALKKQGFHGIVLDKDNTLTAPYTSSLFPALAPSLQYCKATFPGRVVLFSNSAGLYQYDPDGSEAKALEDVIGIPVVRHVQIPSRKSVPFLSACHLFLPSQNLGDRKPSGTAKDIEQYFGSDSSHLVMIGDRHFTDIIYGNRNGFLTILTEPLTLTGEPFIVRQIRKLENMLVNRWCQNGLTAANHHLLVDEHSFIKIPK